MHSDCNFVGKQLVTNQLHNSVYFCFLIVQAFRGLPGNKAH